MRRLERLEWIKLAGCSRAYVARSRRARLLGLAGLDEVPEGWGLLIPGCRSVHTFGMRFALDIDFLDERGRPLRRFEAVEPRRVVWCRAAAAVLEQPSRSGD